MIYENNNNFCFLSIKFTIYKINEQEYFEAIAAIDDELSDIEVMNQMSSDSMSMKVIENKSKLEITTVSTYNR